MNINFRVSITIAKFVKINRTRKNFQFYSINSGKNWHILQQPPEVPQQQFLTKYYIILLTVSLPVPAFVTRSAIFCMIGNKSFSEYLL